MLRKSLLIAAVAVLAPAAAAPDAGTTAIGYICGAERAGSGSGPRELTRQEGVGNSRLAISTASPEAQAWFDYGLQLADGFYHDDAKAAFARAASLDPQCAMCLAGEAWARGDTLNFTVPKADIAKALALVEKAETLPADGRDRAIIAALKLRYSGDDRHAADEAFARAMDALAAVHPEEPELAVMAAQGWLMPARRGDRSGVERAIRLLDGVLTRQPDHAGAIHFYIHATEFAGRAGMALPFAERLPQIAPAASHLVHMPAHTLFRMGRYEDAGLLNARALGVEASYRRAQNAPGPLGSAAYYGHNFSFGLAGAMMAGDGPLALRYAAHTALAYPMDVPAEQRDNAIARSYLAYARFDPDRALAIPEPPKEKAGQRLMRHYARGEAFAARGDAAGVRREAKAAAEVQLAPTALMERGVQAVGSKVLEGRAAMLAGDLDGAVRAYAAAAQAQDQQLRDLMDPPPWWYPARRSLAAALLAQGQPADAAAEARRSLAAWPQDGVALRILAEAEARLGRPTESRRLMAQARRSYRGDVAAIPAALL